MSSKVTEAIHRATAIVSGRHFQNHTLQTWVWEKPVDVLQAKKRGSRGQDREGDAACDWQGFLPRLLNLCDYTAR